ncbi:MAG: hypothetical protein ACKPGO_16115, partial [Microcystis panniformis]
MKPEIFYPNASPLLFQQTLSKGEKKSIGTLFNQQLVSMIKISRCNANLITTADFNHAYQLLV